jgi:hypothetical protein
MCPLGKWAYDSNHWQNALPWLRLFFAALIVGSSRKVYEIIKDVNKGRLCQHKFCNRQSADYRIRLFVKIFGTALFRQKTSYSKPA